VNLLAVYSLSFLVERTIVPNVEHINNLGVFEGLAGVARIGLMFNE
ncbi:uncharacterized protein METZ01_LOCUS172543, partial [marine metagenome]